MKYDRCVAVMSDDERTSLSHAQPDRLVPVLGFSPPETMDVTEGWIRYHSEQLLAEIERNKLSYTGGQRYGRLGQFEDKLSGGGFSTGEAQQIADAMCDRLCQPYGIPLSGAFLRQGAADARIVNVVDMTDELALILAGLQRQEER